MNNIYLTGFMASGKSTLGPILANTIGFEFADLDKEIEKKINKKVNEIFKDFGEKYFRDIEKEIITLFSEKKNVVVSLGGGAINSVENLSIIKKSGILIFLNASPESIYQRLKFKKDRPAFLFEDFENPTKEMFLSKINALFEARKKYYSQADLIFQTDNISIGKTVDLIVKKLNSIHFVV
jgi:shikimate kinase